MKRYLTIIFLLITSISFGQQKYVVKVQGQPGIYGLANNATGDSLIFYVQGVRKAIPVTSNVDLTNYYNKTEANNLLNGKLAIADSASKYITPTQLGAKRDTSYKEVLSVFKPLYSVNINDSTNELHAYMSTDSALSDASDTSLVSSLAVKKYVDKKPVSQEDIKFNYLLNGDTLITADPLGWDSTLREMGNVIYDGNKWIMLYSGNKMPYIDSLVWVGYATSIDKKTWTKRGKIIEQPIEDPYLVFHNGIYYLYAEDKSVIPFTGISLHTSTDLVNWTDHGLILNKGDTLSWEQNDVSSPAILIEDGTFYLFYEGRRMGDLNQPGAVGLATSTDGINFTKYVGNPIITGTGTPLYAPMRGDLKWATHLVPDDIFKVQDKYYMTVHALEPNSFQFVCGIMESSDKITWTDYLGSWVSRQDSSERFGDGLMIQWNGEKFITYFYDKTNTSVISGTLGVKSDYYLGSKPLTTLSTVTFPKYANSSNDPKKVLSTDSAGNFKLVTLTTGASVSNADSLGGEPASNYYLKTAVDAALATKANDNEVAHLGRNETYTGIPAFMQYMYVNTWIVGAGANIFAYKSSSNYGFIGTNSTGDSSIGIISGINSNSYIPLFLKNANASVKTRAYTGQVANIQQWEDVNGNVLSSVDKDGKITAPNIRTLTTGTAAPTTTPAKVGDEYIDTTNKKVYKATGTSSSSDWTILN